MQFPNKCSDCNKIHTGDCDSETDEDDKIDSGLLRAMTRLAPRPTPKPVNHGTELEIQLRALTAESRAREGLSRPHEAVKEVRPQSLRIRNKPQRFPRRGQERSYVLSPLQAPPMSPRNVDGREELSPLYGDVGEARVPPLRIQKDSHHISSHAKEPRDFSIGAVNSGAKAYLQQLNAGNARERQRQRRHEDLDLGAQEHRASNYLYDIERRGRIKDSDQGAQENQASNYFFDIERRGDKDFDRERQTPTSSEYLYDIQEGSKTCDQYRDSLSPFRLANRHAHQSNESSRHHGHCRHREDPEDTHTTREFLPLQRQHQRQHHDRDCDRYLDHQYYHYPDRYPDSNPCPDSKPPSAAQLARTALKQYYHHDRQLEEDLIDSTTAVPHYEDPPGDLEHPSYRFVLDRPQLPSDTFMPLGVIPENEKGARRQTHFEFALNRLEGRIADEEDTPENWKREWLKKYPHTMYLNFLGR